MPEEGGRGESRSHHEATQLANPQLVSSCAETVDGTTNASPNEMSEPTTSAETTTPTDKNASGGLQVIRQSFELEGLSVEVREFFINSWHEGTPKQYSP